MEIITLNELRKNGWSSNMIAKYLPTPMKDKTKKYDRLYWDRNQIDDTIKSEEVKKALEDRKRRITAQHKKNKRAHDKRIEWIEHNKDIISDNIFHALKSGEYSEEEINEYRKTSRTELKKLRRFIDSGGIPVLDSKTEMYAIPNN